MFENSVITNAGAKLLEQWVGGGSLKIDRAAAGTGTVPVSTLPGCTSLANEVQEVSLMAKNWTEDGLRLHLQFKQTAQDYTVNQVGVWAHIEGGGEGSEQSALLAIFQDDGGFEIPSSTSIQDFEFAFYAMIATDNRGSITVNYDSTAYLPRSVVEEVEQDLTDLANRTTTHVDEEAAAAVKQIKADTADAVEKMEQMLNRAALPSTTITIPADGWTPDPENGGLNSIVIKDTGVAASNKTAYFADLVQSGSEESDSLARDGWTQITRMVAGDGQVTVYALEVPETPFQSQIVALDVKEGTGLAEIMILRRGGTGVNSKDIAKAVVELDHESFVFDETEHSPVITQVTLRGKQLETPRDYIPLYVPATNAGEYSIVVLGVREYGGVVEAPWSITQATGSVSLSSDTLTVKGVMGTVDSSVTVTRKGTGAITAESQSPANATAEIINGNTVKVTSVKAGQAKIKIKVAETANYAAAETELTVTVEKATGSISVAPQSITIQGAKGTTAEVTLEVTGDGTVTVDTSSYVTTQRTGNKLKLTSVEAGSQTLNIRLAETENYTGASCTLKVEVKFFSIYGIEWDGQPGTKWQRTGAAQDFLDPVPYYQGMSGSPSSPFDKLMPWAGMVVSEDPQCGKVVAIPKFWYRLSVKNSGLSIEISDGEAEGFVVDPAHMNRGSTEPEVDTVYVGRYHCATSTYKSTTGAAQACSVTHSNCRTNIQKLGDHIYMMDHATWFTLQLLFLVEFADWGSQEKIGWGGSDTSGSKKPNGQTDDMPYHTGTTASKRDAWGFTQYRNIEGLWDNVLDWLDGCYYDSNGLNIILDPAKFHDTQNGTLIGKPTSGYPSKFAVSDAGGYPMFYPTESNGSNTTFSCDNWDVGSGSNPCLYVGGNGNQNRSYGLFYVNYNSTSNSYGNVGGRLLKRAPSGGV